MYVLKNFIERKYHIVIRAHNTRRVFTSFVHFTQTTQENGLLLVLNVLKFEVPIKSKKYHIPKQIVGTQI